MENVSQHHKQSSPKKGSVLAWVICGLAAFFYCYEYLLRITPSVMMNDLMSAFALHAAGIGILAALYNYAYTPLQMVVGLTLDYKGPRKVLTVCMGLCAIGALLFGLAHWVAVAALGRILIGVGSAFAYVGVLKLATIWLPPSRFALFVGLTNFLGMLGAMTGDIGLAHVTEVLGWRGTMVFASAIGFVLVPIFWWVVRDNHKQLVAESDETKIRSFRELFEQFLQIIKLKPLWLIGTVGSLYYLALTVFADMWGIPYLQLLMHVDRVQAAKMNSMVYFGWLIAAPLIGFLSDFLRTRKKIMIIGGFGTFITFTLFLLKSHWHGAEVYVILFLFGCFSTAEILAFAVASESVKTSLAATSLAFVNFLIMLGGMLLQPAIGILLEWHWLGKKAAGVHHYSVLAYQHALWSLPVLFFIGTILCFFIPETYRRTK